MLSGSILAITIVAGFQGADRTTGPELSFNRDIRPILSDRCWPCHGPDSAARKVGLRLDSFEAATEKRRDGAPIVPGNPEASLLLRRIAAHDPDERMPPVKIGKPMTRTEIDLFHEWISHGAAWEPHWSFRRPVRPTTPADDGGVSRSSTIDGFIRERLDDQGLRSNRAADRVTLIRRLTLDLTGLPPTPDEVDAFIADSRPDAYETVIDRLFSTPAHAEHMARLWLDAARYGDTHGLHLDNRRSMWPWRDWVIDAYAENKPFDEFVIEQLAGDLLPDATLAQRIATGFNRNNVTTSEGGAIAEEYRVKYAVDRVNTLSTVFMGLTVQCAQCHDHKFDPITHQEYYGLFAYYGNTADPAMDGNRPDTPPVVRAPTKENAEHLAALESDVAALEAALAAPLPEADAAQAAWIAGWRAGTPDRWETLVPIAFASTGGATLRELDDHSLLAEGTNPERDTYRITLRTGTVDLRVLRLEALTHESLPFRGPGRADNANLVLSEIEVEAISAVDSEVRRPVQLVAAIADHEQVNGPYLAAHAIDGIVDDSNGWAVEGYNRRESRELLVVAAEPFGFPGGTDLVVTLRFETRFAKHAIGRVRIAASTDPSLSSLIEPTALGPWFMVGPFRANDGNEAFAMPFGPEQALSAATPGVDLAAVYHNGQDDTRLAWIEKPEFTDGTVHALAGESCATYLTRTIRASSARRIQLSIGSDDGIKIWNNGEVVHDNMVARGAAPDQDRVFVDLAPGPNTLLMKVVNLKGEYGFYFQREREGDGAEFLQIARLLDLEDQALDVEQAALVRTFYRRHYSPEFRRLSEELRTATKEREAYRAALPTTLIMAERSEPRLTYLLDRGEYDRPRGDPIAPGVPSCLPPLPDDAPPTRLGLANWLVSPDHPLTARVTVNRLWQQLFGAGIVLTSEDFGAQGARPSHPDLLDWLAVEFVESGWDVRHMLRLMVTSEAYRRSSAGSPDQHQRDPENRLIGHGPRFRLDAEVIRDQALAASGLLVRTIGGPSVRPYQPSGLWAAVGYPDSDTSQFSMDAGEALFRRSMYTFWKRTSPPPNLLALDAPSRENCTVRRARTNTPLQALVLLNDPQFVEMARGLAQRVLREIAADDAERIRRAFRLVLAHTPTQTETQVLLRLLQTQRATFAEDPNTAEALLGVGTTPRDESLDAVEVAALTNVAATILSLDEAVTKG